MGLRHICSTTAYEKVNEVILHSPSPFEQFAIVVACCFAVAVYLMFGLFTAEFITNFSRRENPRRHTLIILVWPIYLPLYMLRSAYIALMYNKLNDR